MIRVDLHVHSSASADCHVNPLEMAAQCRRFGLDPIFLTDHDTIDGALELRRQGSFRVVVGEEVMTSDGELVGLFLEKSIAPGLDAVQTASRIKEQKGLVYLEHPYDEFRRHLSEDAIERIADMIDIVEVFNSRSDARANRKAQDLCDTLGAAPGAGSDSHSLRSIGSAYTEMEDFSDADDFLSKLREGKIVTGRSRFLQMAESRLRHRMGR